MLVTKFFTLAPLVMAIAFESSAAQKIDQTEVCSRAGVKQVEKAFRKRRESREARTKAESALRNLLASCPTIADREKIQRKLDTVEEENAQFHLWIALFYLSADGEGRTKGALYRLKRIYDEYPHFSKRAEVLYMLGDLNARVGKK